MNCVRRSLLFFLVSILIVVVAPVQAGNNDNPPPLPGWTHSPAFSVDTPQRHGIVLAGGNVVFSSPVIAEIDANAANGKEVAVAGRDGILYVYGSNGSVRWAKDVMPWACSVESYDHKIMSSPAVGQLAGNGIPYVVVGYGSILATNCDGGIAVYDGRNGNLAWRFSLRSWAQQQGYSESLYGVVSSPALADVDNDGLMEIGFGGFDRNVYLLNVNGSVRWYYHAADTVWSSPAFADTNGDKQLEMIIGTDISANSFLGTNNGGYVTAFDTKQRPANSLRVDFQPGAISSPLLWRTYMEQVIYSSPAIGDVLPNSPGQEVVVGAGCYFPGQGVVTSQYGKWVRILRLSDGALLQTLNTNADCVQSSPALGDIDDDGRLEIVATVGSYLDNASDLGKIIAWDAENPTPKWTMVPYLAINAPNNPEGNDEDGGNLQSPVIADIDGNGSLEVLAANLWTVHVLNGKTGQPLTCQNNQCGTQTSLFTWGFLKATPAVGDVNGDGQLDVVIGGMHATNGDKGMLYGWTGFAGLINSPSGAQPAQATPWPQFRGNARHTAVYPAIVASTPQVSFMIEPGQSRSYALSFESSEGTSINWSASENDPNNIIELNRSSGASSDQLVVTIANPSAGSYTASVSVQSQGLENTTVTFKLNVVNQIYPVYQPFALR